MENNNIFPNNIEVMSKSDYYNEAKNQSRNLGIVLPKRWNEAGSTKDYWRRQVANNTKSITKRNKQFNKALKISRETGVQLSKAPATYGTNHKDWMKEIRRLQAQQRRNSKQYQTAQARKAIIKLPLKQIKQTKEQRRQTKRAKQTARALKEAVNQRNTKLKFDRLINQNNFQSILNIITNENKVMSNNQAQRLYNKILAQGRYVITYTVNGVEYIRPVNASTRDTLIQILTNGRLDIANINTFGSDTLDEVDFTSITSMIIRRITPTREIQNRDGRFFPYLNTTNEDLSKYQIFNQEQAYDKNLIKKREHCLTFTLLASGVSKSVVNEIKMSYFGNEEGRVNISKKDLHQISNSIKRDIIVHTISSDRIQKQKIKSTNNEESEPINIALHSNHYFLYDKSDYSKYSITHYEELKDVKDFKNIIKIKIVKGKSYYERSDSKINSLLLVDKLHKQNYFKKLDLIKFDESNSHKELKNHIYLDNIENEQQECKASFTEAKLIEGKMPDKEQLDKEHEEFMKEVFDDDDNEPLPDNINNILDNTHNQAVNIFDHKVERQNEKEKKIKEKPKIFYADCESYVNKEDLELQYANNNHKLQLLGIVSDDNDFVNIMNVNEPRFRGGQGVSSEQYLTNEFMSIATGNGKHNGLVYFHNLKYDYHILEKNLNIKDRCEKDNQIYSINCKYKGKEVELRDSFKILPFALSKFQKELNLPEQFNKKEAIAYDYYTKYNNNKRCKVLDYNKLLSKEEQLIFLKQIIREPSYNVEDKTFDPLEYYKEYLRLDCLVLKKGIQKFNTVIQEITENKMNVYDCLTISSLTDKYMMKEGAYKDVYEMKGNLRAYVAKAVYGGRVSVNEIYKKKVIEGKIADYDGVSLYPSAINRLCREIGLPKGKAKRFTQEQFKDWDKMTYSILTVKITKVNKIQQMPFIAYKNEKEGSINYLNTPPPEALVIDSTTLKDYIKFHDIEYEISEGVYWNEGGNKKMGEVIKTLFEARLKYKKTNTALANTIKLMLNSSYGKTIMKKTTTETKIVKTTKKSYNKKTKKWVVKQETDFERYIFNNFNTIKYYRKLNDNSYEVERTKSDNSYNRGHIGCAILSTSKRIMNEVFDIANTKKYPIYYTDTDSLHCNCEDVPKLEEEYKKIYNKELNGKQLEQFHTDFDLKGSESEIYATKSIFLGKKSYIDCLESKDQKGNTIKGFHIRLKGITKEGLNHEAKKYNNSYLGLYEDLAKGKEIVITLNPYDIDNQKQKVLFEYKKGNVSFKDNFTRKVKF